MELHEKLKQHRKNIGLTQEAIAEKLKVSRQTISNWETGKSLPDIYSLVTLSEVYDLSLDELIKGDVQVMNSIKTEKRSNKAQMKFLLFGILGVILIIGNYLIGSNYNSHLADFVNGMGYGMTAAAIVSMAVIRIIAKKAKNK
ncbi:helix-turn-helix domain-containing protein [Enterococcus alishanensis]|uniref:Helix-turn-helix domain-containing protein n=1 Tax=Enterococcus alishanensis TaxID=1303817 RepID=A0ABS6T8H7_9ENTE|nr:helix-turn-helix transcriptional regulator [Enterococcus alishanensis]MBV7389196.1 helix-turn-helix domain-containing protein [Enterococcus alishanensis]